MVAVSPDGSCAYVANIGSGSVTAIDLARGERIANIPTGAGCEGVDVAPDGSEIWTSDRSANTVSVIDAATLEVVDRLETPSFPIRIKFTPDGKYALVSCAQAGELVVFDARDRELLHTIPMEWQAAEGSEGHLFKNAFGDSPVPIGIQVRPDGKVAFVANSNANLIAVVDLEAFQVTGTLTAGRQPDGLGWTEL